MRFGVLGPLAVWTELGEQVAVPESKVRMLLADLLAHRGRPVSADRLVDDLWGDRPPRDPLAALRVKVSQLRTALTDREAVKFRASGYLLDIPADAVDAGRFQALVARRTADPAARAAELAEALGLWRGPAYADFADAGFAAPVIAGLEEARLAAVEELSEIRLALGEPVEVADLVTAHPLRERLRAVHMTALYRAGLQSEALATYGDLRERLADELGLDPSPGLSALHAQILRQDPALQPPIRPRTNLPAPLTDLIGREAALTEVTALLRANRLVTLTGPGGVGKTRLALAAAASAEPAFPDGVWLVELATLRPTPTAGVQGVGPLCEVVGAVLGLRDDSPDAMADRLAAALAPKRALLVLDNCEHVVEQVAALARRLLQGAPGLRILATSQETLRVSGEVPWSVPPLAPKAAAELFAARAGVTLDDAAAVDEICARLDGIPLAVELAAARARALTPRQLADRLDDRFRLLTSGRRDAPARQQTLRAMIDWSWELLTDSERRILRRLAVHADGCTLEAAESVCAEPGLDVLDLLARLVDRSLVVGGARFRLLESVAAYSAERLEEAGERDLVRLRHVDYHVALAERAEPRLRGHEQQRWLDTLDAESANLRAALESAVRLGAAERAHRLVNALAWYWVLRGRLGEARRSLESALSLSDDPRTRLWLAGITLLGGEVVMVDTSLFDAVDDPLLRARAQWFVGSALFGFEDLSCSDALMAPALETFLALGDRWGIAAALSVRAKRALLRGDLAMLEADGSRSLELFREVGDRWGQMRATANLSTLAEIVGDYERAAGLRREELRVAEELGLWSAVTDSLSRLGRIALLTGDHAMADDYHEQARRRAAEDSDRPAEEFAEIGLALSARRQGRLDDAERRLRRWLDWVREVSGEPGAALILAELGFIAEARAQAETALGLHLEGLAAARSVGDPRAVALALEGVAGARALQDRHEEAALLLGQAAALRESAGAPLPPGERGDVDRIAATARAALGDRPYAAATERGATLPLTDLIERAHAA